MREVNPVLAHIDEHEALARASIPRLWPMRHRDGLARRAVRQWVGDLRRIAAIRAAETATPVTTARIDGIVKRD